MSLFQHAKCSTVRVSSPTATKNDASTTLFNRLLIMNHLKVGPLASQSAVAVLDIVAEKVTSAASPVGNVDLVSLCTIRFLLDCASIVTSKFRSVYRS